MVRSNSGKVALGPWSGPFGTNEQGADDSPVLYMDRDGSCHKSLDEGVFDLALSDVELPRAVSPTHGHVTVLVPSTPVERKAQALEVAAIQRKSEAKWIGKTVQRSARKAPFGNRVGGINQPRRYN